MIGHYFYKCRLIATISILLILCQSCKNQKKETSIIEISQKYCTELDKIETINISNEVVLNEMMYAAIALNKNNKELINGIKRTIGTSQKTIDEEIIAYTFASEFVSDLLTNCPKYTSLARLQLPKAEKKNKTITYVSDRVKGFMKEWEHLALPEIYDRATDSIVTNLGYAGSSYSDYGSIDQYLLEPLNDIHINLLHTSDVYFKSFLANEQLRAMGVEAKIFPMGVKRKWNFSEVD